VLAGSLTHGARNRARALSSEVPAIRWLARNARSVGHFLQSLARLRRCAGQAGYRALERAAPPRRLAKAPRLLLATGMVLLPLEGRAAPRRAMRFRCVPARG